MSIRGYFSLIFIALYSFGIQLPVSAGLLFEREKRFSRRNIALLFVTFVYTSRVFFVSNEAFWIFEAFKILDFLLFFVAMKKAELRQTDIVLLGFSIFILLFFHTNNENFSGWLIVLLFGLISSRLKRRKFLLLFVLALSWLALEFSSNSAMVAIIIGYFFNRYFSLKSFLLLSSIIILLIYKILLENEQLIIPLASLAPTAMVRFSLWAYYVESVSSFSLFFGDFKLLKGFVDLSNSSLYHPFVYVGKSYHNILLDLISRYGGVYFTVLFFLIKSKINTSSSLFWIVIILWSLEPGLGNFQLATLCLLFSQKDVSYSYS